MKLAICTIISALIGLFLGYSFNPGADKQTDSVVEEPKDNQQQKFDDLKKKFQSLSDIEINNYVKEQDPYLKGEKADALLTKLIKLFLVDIGLRISDLNTNFNKSKLNYLEYKKSRIKDLSKTSLTPLNCEYSKSICQQKYGEFISKGEPLNWRRKELDLRDLMDEQDYKKFLDKVKVTNLNKFIANAKMINRAYVKLFSGTYKGSITYDKGRGELDVFMNLDEITYKKGKPSGTFNVIVYDRGKIVGNKKGTGELQDLTSFASRSQGFIVHTGPSRKLQIYSSSDNSTLFGNVYERKAQDYLPVGKIILSRE